MERGIRAALDSSSNPLTTAKGRPGLRRIRRLGAGRRELVAGLVAASGATGEGVINVEAGREGHVAELVDGDLSQEFFGEVQRETHPQRLEQGRELLAAHRSQACDKFVQFLVRHGVYTQHQLGRLVSRRADYQLPTAKEIPAGVLLRIDGRQG